MPYIPNSSTRPVEPGIGSPVSDINVAEVIARIVAGDGRQPSAGGTPDDATLPEPRKVSTWIMNFGNDPRSPASPGDFDPSTITNPNDEVARRTDEEGEVHPLIRLTSPDQGPRFKNGGPDGQGHPALGWLLAGLAGAALAGLCWIADKMIPPVDKPTPAPVEKPTDSQPDAGPESPAPEGEANQRRDPDAPSGPMDDAKLLRNTIASILGKDGYSDPNTFMVTVKAAVDGLMTGKLNALGLLLAGRELNGGGNIGMSLDDARKLAADPAVVKLVETMPFQPDLEGVAYLIQLGHVFQKLTKIQAALASASNESDRKTIKTRRERSTP